MRVLPPKFVSKANSWCVTKFTESTSANTKKSGGSQTQTWFSTEEEARKFYIEETEKAKTE